ncbi:MAG: hypothetical protein HYZ08_00815 [Candidatus Kerfeldbacteria bacterium]|nr:hypothetical protein [Candidatus Kerfeldbacteria bacterium]
MKKKYLILVFLSAVIIALATGFIDRGYIDYGLQGTRCFDCVWGHHSYGFPFEAMKDTNGGFTGGERYLTIGLFLNFVIYFVSIYAVSYLFVNRRKLRT